MTQEEILKIFKKTGAFLEGHFLLTSGLHSGQYIQCARILEDPEITEMFAQELVKIAKPEKVDWVVGPAMGGILLAYELSRALNCKNAFTERVDGAMALRRNFSIPQGSRVLVCEDVFTTGGSALEVAKLVEANGAKVVGIVSLVNRSGVKFPYPAASLLNLTISNYESENCPFCKEGKPVTKPGSRPKTAQV